MLPFVRRLSFATAIQYAPALRGCQGGSHHILCFSFRAVARCGRLLKTHELGQNCGRGIAGSGREGGAGGCLFDRPPYCTGRVDGRLFAPPADRRRNEVASELSKRNATERLGEIGLKSERCSASVNKACYVSERLRCRVGNKGLTHRSAVSACIGWDPNLKG